MTWRLLIAPFPGPTAVAIPSALIGALVPCVIAGLGFTDALIAMGVAALSAVILVGRVVIDGHELVEDDGEDFAKRYQPGG
jgi:hypothetical protein